MSGRPQAAGVRLRQAVFAAGELEPVANQLRAALGLQEPFRDPGVGFFGLHNVVFALGDCDGTTYRFPSFRIPPRFSVSRTGLRPSTCAIRLSTMKSG